MNQDLLNALLIALMPFLVSIALTLFRVVLSKLPENKQALAQQVAHIVVTAVEQMWKSAPGTNEEKKAEALKLASAMLKDLGLRISPVTLNALIESAVHSLPPTDQGAPVQPVA